MLDLIQRHVVIDPVVPGYGRQVALADSVAIDGRTAKNRTGPEFDLAPEDCQLQVVDNVVLNPFVWRPSCGSQRIAQA